MKVNKILGGMVFGAIFAAGLASCSNEVDLNVPDQKADMLLRAPRAVAYAGNQKNQPFTLGYAPGVSRAAAGVTSEPCQTTLIDREHETEIINEWLPEKNGNLKEGLDTDFLFVADEDLSLEFYPVFSQTSTQNDLGVFYYDADGEYHEVIVWENMNPWALYSKEQKWDEEKGLLYDVVTSKGIQINVPAGCVFGFFWKGNNNTGKTTYYSSSDMNEEVNCTDGNGNPIGGTSKIHAVTFTLEGKTYLGLEDWTDFDYQDWVFTCDKVLKTVNSSTFEPGNKDTDPDPDPETPVVPDPETPDVPDPETPETPDTPDTPTTPDTPDQPAVGNEVEVNLSLDEKADKDIVSSHLSIHVRTATDVDIFIPVPAQYYCDADDMAIVMKHEKNHMDHGGPTEFTWTLKDSDLTVSLFVEYLEEGIHVWTDGITQEVIDWCYEKCQDGITFELWNYFNDPDGYPLISKEELRRYLDQATIEFLDKVPDYYVNAFADPNAKYDAETNPEGDDFHVRPRTQNNFDEPYEGTHQNNSDFNDIYKKNQMPTPPPVPVY